MRVLSPEHPRLLQREELRTPKQQWGHCSFMAGIDMVGQVAEGHNGKTLAYSENQAAALRLLEATHPAALQCQDFNLGQGCGLMV